MGLAGVEAEAQCRRCVQLVCVLIARALCLSVYVEGNIARSRAALGGASCNVQRETSFAKSNQRQAKSKTNNQNLQNPRQATTMPYELNQECAAAYAQLWFRGASRAIYLFRKPERRCLILQRPRQQAPSQHPSRRQLGVEPIRVSMQQLLD